MNTKNGFKQSADWSVKIEFLENLIEPLGANTSNRDSLQARALGLARIHLDSSCVGVLTLAFLLLFFTHPVEFKSLQDLTSHMITNCHG